MIIFLITVIVITISFTVHWKYFRQKLLQIEDFLIIELLSLFIGAIIGTIIWVIPYEIINTDSTNVNYTEIAQYELLPISDNTYYTKEYKPLSDSLYISFTYKHPQLGIVQDKLTISQSQYFYDYISANETPYVVQKQIHHHNYLIDFFFGPFNLCYIFYIPEGVTTP